MDRLVSKKELKKVIGCQQRSWLRLLVVGNVGVHMAIGRSLKGVKLGRDYIVTKEDYL